MVKILADSTCDLSPELIARYGIGIIPLYVHLGEEEFRDGVDITPEELFKWSDEHNTTPKTAAPGIEDIEALLDKDGSDEYVIFTISSSMSSSYTNCTLAADDLEITDRVFVIDSQNLSTGIALLVLKAAQMAAQGMSGSEIAQEIGKIRGKVRASFVIDTLTYLYRGGRCSGLSAFFGSALKLHPRIAVAEGAMHPEKKYRGRSSKFVLDYVRDMEQDLKAAQPDRVFITHSGCDRQIVESVQSYLEGLHHFDEILETRAGAVVSSHCGPGTLGVLFIAGDE
ncbi:MAG: DegV family protein [Lachnospiraceae bacterium]|nr:DegV family protein [Lachnospiraceae bacterium]